MGTESNREKYKNFKINNKNLYERYKEEPISLTMKVNKWKVLGHATCYFPKIHLQEKLWLTIFKILESTKKYQEVPRKSKKDCCSIYSRNQRNVLQNDATILVKQFTSIDDLNILLIIAQDRKQ